MSFESCLKTWFSTGDGWELQQFSSWAILVPRINTIPPKKAPSLCSDLYPKGGILRWNSIDVFARNRMSQTLEPSKSRPEMRGAVPFFQNSHGFWSISCYFEEFSLIWMTPTDFLNPIISGWVFRVRIASVLFFNHNNINYG